MATREGQSGPSGVATQRPDPNEQGNRQGGGPGGSGDGGKSEPGPAGMGDFNREELDPALRGLNAKSMNELFMALLRQNGQNSRAEAEPAAPPKPVEELNYKELLDPNHENFNPQKAFAAFVEQNYGGLIGDINKRSVQGLYSRYKSQIHDFDEYEADIESALSKRDPSSLSDKDVLGTYLTLKGARTLAKERLERATQAGTSTHKPSAPNDDKKPGDDIVLSDDQKTVAKVMFSNEADPEAKYKEWKTKADAGPHELKVPLDATGKRG